MACSAGGRIRAAAHCTAPPYEPPAIPTRPSHHGCAAVHAMLSAPSRPSSMNGVNAPPDANRPRTSCTTTAYPAFSARRESSEKSTMRPASRLYGTRCSSAGNGPRPSGRYTSAASSTPSRIGTTAPFSTVVCIRRASADGRRRARLGEVRDHVLPDLPDRLEDRLLRHGAHLQEEHDLVGAGFDEALDVRDGVARVAVRLIDVVTLEAGAADLVDRDRADLLGAEVGLERLLLHCQERSLVVDVVEIRRWGRPASPLRDRLDEEALAAEADLLGLVAILEHDRGAERDELVVRERADHVVLAAARDRVAIQLVLLGDVVW